MKKITIMGEELNENAHIEEIINGKKQAFCTPEVWYGKAEGESEATVGDQIVLLDPSGKERVVIEITDIQKIRFDEADEKLSRAELDCDLQDFRDAHRFYWEEELAEDNIVFDDSLIIIVEYFKIINIY
ncbi:MAG: ASCH domain-containing protein [Deltaproteobacteria bacterium]|nr:ASCH domain-containing protein [Deltaproteobacteria bacterium]